MKSDRILSGAHAHIEFNICDFIKYIDIIKIYIYISKYHQIQKNKYIHIIKVDIIKYTLGFGLLAGFTAVSSRSGLALG